MTALKDLDFDRLRALRGKLDRLLEVEKLLDDPEVSQMLGGAAEPQTPAPTDSPQPALPPAAAPKPPPARTPAEGGRLGPRGPGGRLKRGWVRKKFEPLAERRFREWHEVAAMRQVAMEELRLDHIERNTISGAAKGLVKKGKMEVDKSGTAFRYRWKPVPALSLALDGGSAGGVPSP